MNYPHLAARLFNVPLMARYDFAQIYATTFDRIVNGKGHMPSAEGRVTDSGIDAPARAAYSLTEDGIAVLTVEGPLVQRAGQIAPDCSPLASYQWVNVQLLAMAADPKVKAMLLEFDSPGGEVSNVFELGSRIRGLPEQSGRPLWAIANEGAYSAAYALAAGAQRITLPATAMAGSIGVIMLHLDVSRAAEKKGYTFTPIFAGARKNDFSPTEPLSKEALTVGQARVDQLMGVFSGFVADARNIDQAAVLATEAGIFGAADAVRLGLADEIATFDETLGALRDHLRSGRSNGVWMAASSPSARMENLMTDKEKAAADQAAAEQRQQELATARGEGQKEGIAQATAELTPKIATASKEGAAEERVRIKSILASDAAKSRPKLAQHLAFGTDMSAEAATAMLAEAGLETSSSNPLADAMGKVPNPKVGIDGGDVDPNAPKRPMTSAEVIQMRNKRAGVAR